MAVVRGIVRLWGPGFLTVRDEGLDTCGRRRAELGGLIPESLWR